MKTPDMKVFEKLRDKTGVSVSDVCTTMLKVSRPTYYKWVEDNSRIRKAKYQRILIATKALALCLKSGTLPVKDKTGMERRKATLHALFSEIKKMGT